MANTDLDQHVADVRAFNRFYTRQMGLLRNGLLKSLFSLTEARVLYELAHRTAPTATDLGRDLDLDAGYLSRILRRFVQGGLVKKSLSRVDRRQSHLSLTQKGRQTFRGLDRASRNEIGAVLSALDAGEQTRLTAAMAAIQHILAPGRAALEPFVLRPHRAGDMGWVVHRQAILYAREYGWDWRFEGLVANVAAQFIEAFDPQYECCWIAEREGSIVGSVFVVRISRTEARLRMLYVGWD